MLHQMYVLIRFLHGWAALWVTSEDVGGPKNSTKTEKKWNVFFSHGWNVFGLMKSSFESIMLQMKTVCSTASSPKGTLWHWWFEASPEKYFPFSFHVVFSRAGPSSLLLHTSLILLTSTTCLGRLQENSGIYVCLVNNSSDIKTHKAVSSAAGALQEER